MTGFHAQGGWYFRRTDEGRVQLRAPDSMGPGASQVVELDAGTWASAIASVCAVGETAESFAAAERFHAGGDPVRYSLPIQAPTLGRIVHYRGKQGLQTMRAAIVTAVVESLDQRGVDAGHVPPLSDAMHVHLWVFTPAMGAVGGGFAEFDIAPGGGPGEWSWPVRS